MVRKPVSVFAEIGHTEPNTTTKIIAAGLKPNQSIASGKIAIPGSGLKMAVRTVNRLRPKLENVESEARAKPTIMPILMPIPRFCNDTSVADGN
jgi:hypothetical protein